MVRPIELTMVGLSLATVYRRAGALGLEKPYRFTPAEVRRILNFPVSKGGRKAKGEKK